METKTEKQTTKLLRISNRDFESFEVLRLRFIKKTDKIINKKDLFEVITNWLISNFDEWTRPEKAIKNTFQRNERITKSKA